MVDEILIQGQESISAMRGARSDKERFNLSQTPVNTTYLAPNDRKNKILQREKDKVQYEQDDFFSKVCMQFFLD